MSHCIARKRKRHIDLVRAQFAQKDGLAFADVLPAELIEQLLEQEGANWRDCVFTPELTLWALLSQVISADGSCRATVARVLAWLVSRGERPCSPETGPYCKARQRLPEELLKRLMHETGQTLHQQISEEWRWNGRRVKLVDGTTVTMADTEDNQAEYPQVPGQKPGLGFPIARVLVAIRASRLARTRSCERWRRVSSRATCCSGTAILAVIVILFGGKNVASTW